MSVELPIQPLIVPSAVAAPSDAPVPAKLSFEQVKGILDGFVDSTKRLDALKSIITQVDRVELTARIGELFLTPEPRLRALAVLNPPEQNTLPVKAETTALTVTTGPKFADRMSGAVNGLVDPVRQFWSIGLVGMLAAGATELVGISLGAIPVLNAVSSAAHTTGFAGDTLAAMTGCAVAVAVNGVTRGFSRGR
jgi:hypothetical protein